MKKLFIIVMLMISITNFAQSEISIMQDPTMALFDDEYGNKAFTTDVLVRYSFIDDYNLLMSVSYEYANLTSYYHRIGLGTGYRLLNKDKYNLLLEIETGIIFRDEFTVFPSFAFIGSIDYKINNKLYLTALGQYTKRSFGWRYNNYVGLKIKL